jgi:hypothetical protein
MTLDKLYPQSFIEIHEKIVIVFFDESSHKFKTTHEQSTKVEMYFYRKTLHSKIIRNTKKTIKTGF